MNLLFLIFIITPIVEIGVFMQVGDLIGLGPTLLMIFVTAILGVNLLKSQGISVWGEMQRQLAQGQMPATAMISAAQLLFAGGLLLTPGFVTDTVGFLLLVPQVRQLVAKYLLSKWMIKGQQTQGSFYSASSYSSSDYTRSEHSETEYSSSNYSKSDYPKSKLHTSDEKANRPKNSGRTIEGEFEDRS